MKFSEIILEGRVENFEKKYSSKFTADQIKRITKMFLPKYLDWVGKNLDSINFDGNFQKVSDAVNKFNRVSTNLPITDLYGYKSIEQLFQELKNYEEKQRRQIRKVSGGNVVYDDGRFFVVNPLTHDSSCFYGKGTKWCTASNSDSNFKKYNEDGKLFYVIDKRLPSNDKFYKVAILKKFDGGEQYWDAVDNQFTNGWILGTDEYKQISSSIGDYINQEFSEQIKIYNDKEQQRIEKERQRKLELERIRREQLQEAQERREEGEWDLGPDCPIIGEKAHALLDWLVDTSDVSVLTLEDRNEIERIKNEIERLQNEYDNDEETRIDLLDEISDLEDELEELEEKIDVYNIVPIGDYYDMTEFKVLVPFYEDRRYAVGDESEIEESCRDYVDGLIDDIGFRGFNESFASDYIDERAVENYADDFYRDDVYNSPEIYFDESERQLSDNQKEGISILKNKISQLEKNILKFENMLDQIEDEDEISDIEEKIQDFRDQIDESETEIEEIEGYPEGDFPDDMIEEKIEELVQDRMRDPLDFLRELDLDWEDFINRREFIQGVIDADGYGHTLNSYDGQADEVYVGKSLYYVMRID